MHELTHIRIERERVEKCIHEASYSHKIYFTCACMYVLYSRVKYQKAQRSSSKTKGNHTKLHRTRTKTKPKKPKDQNKCCVQSYIDALSRAVTSLMQRQYRNVHSIWFWFRFDVVWFSFLCFLNWVFWYLVEML